MTKEEEGKGIKKAIKVVKKTVEANEIATKPTVKKAVKKDIKTAKVARKKTVKKTEKVAKKTVETKIPAKLEAVKKITKKPTLKTAKLAENKDVVDKTVVKKTATKKEVKKVVAIDGSLTKKTTIDKTEEGINVNAKKPDKDRYYKGIGRRKRAVANVRLYPGGGAFIINNKPADLYFNTIEHKKNIYDSLEAMKMVQKFKVQVMVRGGGLHAQSEAIRHGISRALLDFDETFRVKLKAMGLLTRDPRRRERKKPGLKRARKATQWRKR